MYQFFQLNILHLLWCQSWEFNILHQSSVLSLMIFFILIICLLDNAVILYGEFT